MKEPKDILVLIVDDEEILCRAIARDLSKKGYRTVCAHNGREAFEIVKKEKVDVVLSDIRMPELSGVELLNHVKDYNRDIPVVLLMTGFSDLTAEDAYHQGADAIYSKPFDRKNLFEGIRRAVTPKEELWAEQSELSPLDHTISLSFPDLNMTFEQKVIVLGRGGMFVSMTEQMPAAESRVEFKIEFKNNPHPPISGQGIVRWVRTRPDATYPRGMGIEFMNLSEFARHYVLEVIRSKQTKAFIPKG